MADGFRHAQIIIATLSWQPLRTTRFRRDSRARALVALVGVLAWAAGAQAQSTPAPDHDERAPRLAIAGDLSATIGPDDTSYYFNYTDYDHSALRLFVGTFSAAWRIGDRLQLVGEVRLENVEALRLSALYARVRPHTSWPLDLLAGRVPPVFGAFSKYRYGADNPLVSRPLPYQYLTTLRYDAVPANADTLLRVRGRGWLVPYGPPPGAGGTAQPPLSGAEAGLPPISTTRWDTGVEAHFETNRVEASVAYTLGTLSQPLVEENNSGRQLAARVVWRPTPGLGLGVSAAGGGEYLERGVVGALPAPADDGTYRQRGLGADVEFSTAYLRVRGEYLHLQWDAPVIDAPRIDSPLAAIAGILELTCRVRPRIDLAARGDYLGFSDITGTLYGGAPTTWDANVWRAEAGGSYRFTRRLRLKLVYQHDWRFGRTRSTAGFPAAQLSYWF
jgi:hypothetical protein